VPPDGGDAGTASDESPGDTSPADDGPLDATVGAMSDGPDGGDAGSTDTAGDGGIAEQPYGKCKDTCTVDADCCPDGCPSGTDYRCDEGLCRSECVASNCGDIGGFEFGCVTPLMALPGESFCGAVCEGNDCSDIGPAPEFYCNPDQVYTPRVCGYDCRVEGGPGCAGGNGAECLVTGDCGCISEADCRPGAVCFKQWIP